MRGYLWNEAQTFQASNEKLGRLATEAMLLIFPKGKI